MRVKESASEAASGFLPVKVDLILSNQPREARCGVEEIPRLAVRRWSARREAMVSVSASPVSRRRRGRVGGLLRVYCGARAAEGNDGKHTPTVMVGFLESVVRAFLAAQLMLEMFCSL
jgi:hypothetical protein